ncbi:unnamed protein product [Ilex paraguariensis]|uniref:Uncharacterized protein n=1 Tax=Ilex paraguariensis TaxID=185542 RepID=A0ABC8UCT8_9AQUA
MDKEMQQLWSNFTLVEDESLEVHLLDQGDGDLGEKGKLCIFGKVLSVKLYNKMDFKTAMKKFNNMLDKNRVLEGMPWSFDNHLVMLKDYDVWLTCWNGSNFGVSGLLDTIMDKEMQQLWRNFTLVEDESLEVHLLDQGDGDLGERGKLCIFGKVLSVKLYNKMDFKTAMKKFNNMLDKNRVLEGMPWSFDNHLVMLKDYDGTF